jgi:hypothetical protein
MEPDKYNSHDIRHRLIRADTHKLLHKNNPHDGGSRYCIVLFNKDLNYVNSTPCTRSCEIMSQPDIDTHYIDTIDNPEVDAARAELLAILERTTLPLDACTIRKGIRSHTKYETCGYFISLGVTASRKSREERAQRGVLTRKAYNMNNTKFSKVYDAFCRYMSLFAPGVFGEYGMYASCIISRDSQCNWHTDKGNVGNAALSTLGTFSGGELLIQAK